MLALVSGVTIGAVAAHRHAGSATVASADVDSARELLARALTHETEVDRQASLREDSAHAALLRADSATAAAQVAQGRADAARSRFETASRVAPAVCDSLSAAARDALVAKDSLERELKLATSQTRQGATELQSALDSTRSAANDTRAAAGDLDRKAANLVTASKPSLLDRLTPHVGVGLAMGLNAQMQPQTVVGVTVSWRVF